MKQGGALTREGKGNKIDISIIDISYNVKWK